MELIRKYYDSQTAALLQHFDKFIKNREEEELHQARLCFKRLRSMLWLYDLKAESAEKEIYKYSGRIRDLHLIKKKLEKCDLKLKEKKWNTIFENRMSDLLSSLTNHKGELKKGRENIKLLKTSRQSITDKLKENQHHILHLLKKKKNWHEARMLIKHPVFLNKLIKKQVETHLDKIQDLIGKWHDSEKTLKLMRRKPLINLLGKKESEIFIISEKQLSKNLVRKIRKKAKIAEFELNT